MMRGEGGGDDEKETVVDDENTTDQKSTSSNNTTSKEESPNTMQNKKKRKDKTIEKMKLENIDDPSQLPVPRIDFSELQKKLVERGNEHQIRDKRRQTTEDTDAYVNGVLFGFDPNIPLEDQVEGWSHADKPTADQLAELGLAGKAWLKEEQREMGGEN